MNNHSNKKLFLAIEFVCIMLIVGMIGYTFYAISQMPDTIPIHWTNGEVDGWGSKWFSLLMPGLIVVMYVFLFLLNAYMKKRNQSIMLTSWLKLACVILFSFVNWSFIQSVLG